MWPWRRRATALKAHPWPADELAAQTDGQPTLRRWRAQDGSADPDEIIDPMPMITVTRAAGPALHVGDAYGFEREGQHFDGVVRDIALPDDHHVEIALEMTSIEYQRVLATVNR